MPTFVNGSTKPGKEKVVLTSPDDLCRWIGERLPTDFNVEVTHETGVERNNGRFRKVEEYWVKVWTRDHEFYEVATDRTLVLVAKRFTTTLWPKIVEYRGKVKGTVIQPAQVEPPVKATVVVDPIAALPAPRRLGLPAPQPKALPAPKRKGRLFDDYEDETGD